MKTHPRKPKISVCIPAYNCQNFIGYTIKSVLSQTCSDYEIVIVDDCSTDNTKKIIEGFNSQHIRLIKNESNLGMHGNWNKVVSFARGRYIKLLCSDDLLYPDCLEKQLIAFENNNNISIVSSSRDIINKDNKKILKRGLVKGGIIYRKQAILNTIKSGTNIIGEPASVLFSSEMFARAGGFDGTLQYMIDLDLWCRLLLYGDWYFIKEPLCAFRVSSTAVSFSMSNYQCAEYIKFIEKLCSNSEYNITRFIKVRGMLMAWINNLLRKLFYILLIK